jgi:hypothetical protein
VVFEEMYLTCSYENCPNSSVIARIRAVLLGKDETSQQFVFRVWHACAEHVWYYSRYSSEALYQMEKHRGFRMFFLVTPQHLALAKRLSIIWYGKENGGPGTDIVRPYGNSSLISDIAEIVGYPPPEEDQCYSPAAEQSLLGLHQDMHIVLQIILQTGLMKSGIYKKPGLTEDWVEVPHPQKEIELVLTTSERNPLLWTIN